jgi:hypothetical protein
MRRLALILLLVVAIVAAGCGSLNDRYIEADRATFDAVASRYKAYVDADPALTELQKKNRKNTIDSWEARVAAAEEFLGLNAEPDDGSIWFGWGRSRGR